MCTWLTTFSCSSLTPPCRTCSSTCVLWSGTSITHSISAAPKPIPAPAWRPSYGPRAACWRLLRFRLPASRSALRSLPPDRQLRLLRPQLQRLRAALLQHAGRLLLPVAAALPSRGADPNAARRRAHLHQADEPGYLRVPLPHLRLRGGGRPCRAGHDPWFRKGDARTRGPAQP